jgi:D-beta-D-heptose 7-phosphate kinase/D-beta-D-heptose 1-phosphate adenosyltransferase
VGREELAARVRAIAGRTVLVVGDVILDRYLWGRATRVSPEAPVLVVDVETDELRLGGAANVAHNVRALGAVPLLCGLIGDDAAGSDCARLLAERQVDVAPGIVRDPRRRTTLKTRIIAHQQQVVRADREQADDIADALEDELIRHVGRLLPSCRALILSDYQKGVVTPRLMKAVLPLARRRRIPVLVDPKVRHLALYRGATVVTPNQAEAELAAGIRIRTAADLLAAGRRILGQVRGRAVLITRGEHGMSLFERHRPPLHIPTAAREVFDVTGAGDSVIATLALALCAGARLREAAALANFAAGVVVGKVGTAAATAQEILAAVEAGA